MPSGKHRMKDAQAKANSFIDMLDPEDRVKVVAFAREVNVPIYTIGVGTEIDEAVLRKVTLETGGANLITPQPGQLRELYARIGEQLAGA